jgi:DNA ligase 1
MKIYVYDLLYKRDTKGKIREWHMEDAGGLIRTVSGIKDGNLVTSEWTQCYGKNENKANATSAYEQATLEIESHYKKKMEKGYFKTLKDVDGQRFGFEPMLAQKYKKWNGPVFTQPKLDGVRCVAKKDGLFTRNGKPFVSIPHIVEALKPFFEEYPEKVLDGELYNHNLKEDFNQIISLVKQQKPTAQDLEMSEAIVEYHLYDIFDPANPDATFGERTDNLSEAILEITEDDPDSPLQIVQTQKCYDEEELNRYYTIMLDAGYEGQMVRTDDPYENKRSKTLLKRKIMEDSEFEIVAIEEGKGNWAGYAKKVAYKLKDGTVFRAGLAGSQPYAKDLLENAADYVGGTGTVKYQNLTPDGIPRFGITTAVYKGQREL